MTMIRLRPDVPTLANLIPEAAFLARYSTARTANRGSSRASLRSLMRRGRLSTGQRQAIEALHYVTVVARPRAASSILEEAIRLAMWATRPLLGVARILHVTQDLHQAVKLAAWVSLRDGEDRRTSINRALREGRNCLRDYGWRRKH